MSSTFSPALPRFPESFVFFCSRPPRVQVLAPTSASVACLHCALKNPVCFPTTHKLFQDLTTCALLISLIIPFPKTHSIPRTGLAARRSFCLFVQKLSVYLLLSAVATLGFCFEEARARERAELAPRSPSKSPGVPRSPQPRVKCLNCSGEGSRPPRRSPRPGAAREEALGRPRPVR